MLSNELFRFVCNLADERRLLAVRVAQHEVDVGELVVVVDITAELCGRGEDLVEGLNFLEEFDEALPLLLIEKCLIEEAVELLVVSARPAAGELEILLTGGAHKLAEAHEQEIEVFDHPGDVARIKSERFVELFEHPDEVDDETAGLLDPSNVLVGSVDARDGLEKHVVAHRLIEVQ